MKRRTIGAVSAASSVLVVGLAVGGASASDPGAGMFEAPVRLKAGDAFINVEVGHAAPYVYDFDGDGVKDLLVGQFGQGRLRIYRNLGTNEAPRYDGYEYFMAGGVYGTVPAS